jgi:hypothetical protein
VILLHALVAVIHAVLAATAQAIVTGFSLLVILLVVLAFIGALILTLAGGLGLGGARWAWRKRRSGKDGDGPASPPPTV